MKKLRKITLFFLFFSSLFLLSFSTARAVCPVCTVAVGAGLGVSRALGVDDSVVSVWIGGLILSSSFWLNDWLSKKEKLKRFSNIWVVTIMMYAIVLIPLYYSKIIGIAFNTLWGIDKILFGTAVGSVAFLKGVYLDRLQRKKFGKQFFSYQKVVLPFTLLLITSLVLYFITK